jgi:formate C-acetyltransferase
MGTVFDAGAFEALRSEMNAYYDTMRDLRDEKANPAFLGVRNKIYGDMEAFHQKNPGTSALLLKARLHEAMAEHFEPVVFVNSPFFFEMGLRHAANWGTPDRGAPSFWVLGRLDGDQNTDLRRNIRGDTLAGPLGLSSNAQGFDADHHCLGYTGLFKKGIDGILAEIKAEQALTGEEQGEKREFLAAAAQSCRALLLAAEKFARRAEKMREGEKSPRGQKHLEMIASCARKIPARPPETFYEGLAMLWFTREAAASLEGIGISVIGHPDRLLGPLYEADLQRGILDRAGAKDLLARWLLPTDLKFRVRETRGRAVETSTCLELGGCDESGAPVWNEVTRLVMETHEDLKLLNPKLNCRFSASSARDYLEAVAGAVLRGQNNYVMLNDDVLIPGQIRNGKKPEEARLYVNGGCQEIMVEGREHSAGAYYYLSLPRVLDLCLNPFSGAVPEAGPDTLAALPKLIEKADTFEAFYRRFVDEVKKLLVLHLGWRRELGRQWRNLHPCPLFSSTLEGCVSNGRDYSAGGAQYNDSTICACGLGTLTDSLVALKKAVYEEKRMDLEGLRALLRSDWENAEAERRRFIAYPKFGHGEEEADGLAARFVEELNDFVSTIENERGGRFRLSMFVYSAYSYFAPFVRATPDGRKSGDLLSQGVAPGRLRGTGSVTESIRSLSRIDFAAMAGNSVMDAQLPLGKFEEGHLAALFRTFGELGGPTLQPNCVSPEDLLEARAHPEQHQDLTVRLYGLSAYFVRLDPQTQNDIISRNLYGG